MNTIYLNTGDTKLIGRYRNGQHNKVICDATNGDFTVQLPDCRGNGKTTFSNIRYDEDRTKIVSFIPNLKKEQKINKEDLQKLRVGSTMDLETDEKHWYIS